MGSKSTSIIHTRTIFNDPAAISIKSLPVSTEVLKSGYIKTPLKMMTCTAAVAPQELLSDYYHHLSV
jgi:hypothetical protein